MQLTANACIGSSWPSYFVSIIGSGNPAVRKIDSVNNRIWHSAALIVDNLRSAAANFDAIRGHLELLEAGFSELNEFAAA